LLRWSSAWKNYVKKGYLFLLFFGHEVFNIPLRSHIVWAASCGSFNWFNLKCILFNSLHAVFPPIILATLSQFLYMKVIIVFISGSIQDSDSGFWPGHLISAGSIILKKNQNDIVQLKKTKINGLQPSFGPGQPGHRVVSSFSFLCFSFNLARFQPRIGRIPSRAARPSRMKITHS